MNFFKNKKIRKALHSASSPVRWIWPRLPEALIGLFSLILIIFCCLTYSADLARYASKFVTGNKYLALMDGMLNPFRTRHLLLKSGLPIYDLKIKRQQYAIIELAVNGAKKQGWMSDDLKLWANAQFIYNGQQYNVKVRVRGDLSPHWSGPKKSWRIKFGKQKIDEDGEVRKEPIYFQGKRQINLIIPRDREFVLAYFINSLMREAGLVVPRDRFVILRINGTIQGLYYEVEHFDKPLLAAYKRPETTIFGQNDRAMHFEQYTKYGTAAARDARFDIGSMRRLVDRNGELAVRAMQVLIDHSLNPTPENFRRVRTVLDWEKYLRFRVVTTLCNTNHVRFGSDNLRLYYDPSRGLLEPVPWDLHLTRMPKEPGTIDFWNSHGADEIQHATLKDPMLRLQRNKILWELVGDGGDSLMAKFNAIYERIRPLAWADVLSTPIQGHKMDLIKKDLHYNVRRVYKVLSQSNANFTYRLEANDRAALEVVALNFSGIQLRKIEISDSLLFEGNYRLYVDANNNGELDSSDPVFGETIAKNGTVLFEFAKYILPRIKYDSDFIEGRYWEFYDTIAGRSRFFLVGKLAPSKRHPLEWNPPDIQVTAVNAVTGKKIPSAFISQTDPLPEDYMGITAYDASDPFDLDAPEFTLA
ncbi:MAG: CotH kinase family protein, partial [bacterium]